MDLLNDILTYGCRHYDQQPIVPVRGDGIYILGVDGVQYMDAVAGYSSDNPGHCHPRLVQKIISFVLETRLGTVSNAYGNAEYAHFLREVCQLFGYEKALPMNGGVDVWETAVKVMRKFAYVKKSIPLNCAEIIVCYGNFHGRTETAISASDNPKHRYYFGPHTPGFRFVPYGDVAAFKSAIGPYTIGIIIEPIQGEGGIIIPPAGYLCAVKSLCEKYNLLFVADEIQTGLGRTGWLLASWYDNIKPDIVLLGKSLGGGLVPVSVLLTSKDIMVFEPGEHGSTYAGNAFAMTIARESLRITVEENLCMRSRRMGSRLIQQLKRIESPFIRSVRGRGLMIGIELHSESISSSEMVTRLQRNRVLSMDAHDVIRITPPLIISEQEVDELARRVARAFAP